MHSNLCELVSYIGLPCRDPVGLSWPEGEEDYYTTEVLPCKVPSSKYSLVGSDCLAVAISHP